MPWKSDKGTRASAFAFRMRRYSLRTQPLRRWPWRRRPILATKDDTRSLFGGRRARAFMRIDGDWFFCPDGIRRPVFYAEFLAADGSWVTSPMLADTGADRTILSAELAQSLGNAGTPVPTALTGLGGSVPTQMRRQCFACQWTLADMPPFKDHSWPRRYRGQSTFQFWDVTSWTCLPLSLISRLLSYVLSVSVITTPFNTFDVQESEF